MKSNQIIAVLGVLAALAACTPPEVILEGERLGVREALEAGDGADAQDGEQADAPAETGANIAAPITLPAQVAQADWPQKYGSASHKVTHPALGGALSRVWSVSIGAGDSRRHKITADPVVADGRVFVQDARSQVSAFSTAGQKLWSRDLTPAGERNADASGGGLAYEAGQLYATTGFGDLVALDAKTGDELWVQEADAALTGAPAVRDGIVYAVSRNNSAWAVRAEDGRVLWQVSGTPSQSGLVGAAAPAISDRLAVFPLGSAELVATLRKSGVRVWGATVAGQRRGRVYARVSDISGDPVIDGGVIYSGTSSGRVAAMSAAGGKRIWTAEEGTYSPVWPVGGAVFLVSDQAELVRLDGETGERVWGVPLPYFVKDKQKKRKAVFAHYGPVLAGGRLIVASNDKTIRAFDPTDGALVSVLDLPGGASTNPVVAGRTLYIVTANGQLHAFR